MDLSGIQIVNDTQQEPRPVIVGNTIVHQEKNAKLLFAQD